VQPALLVLLINIARVDALEQLILCAPPAVLVLLVNIAPVDALEQLILYAPPVRFVSLPNIELLCVPLHQILFAEVALAKENNVVVLLALGVLREQNV